MRSHPTLGSEGGALRGRNGPAGVGDRKTTAFVAYSQEKTRASAGFTLLRVPVGHTLLRYSGPHPPLWPTEGMHKRRLPQNLCIVVIPAVCRGAFTIGGDIREGESDGRSTRVMPKVC
jgi:hypothetical protein